MEKRPPSENAQRQHDIYALNGDLKRVGDFIYEAMLVVADEVGGDDLVREIAGVAMVADGTLPNPEVLTMLEEREPGSAKRVMDLTADIQERTHRVEREELEAQLKKRRGRSIIEGLRSFGL
jgi:hypothetical protein